MADRRVPAIVTVGFAVAAMSIPFEVPSLHLKWEIPTLATSFFLLTTVFGLRHAYGRVPRPVWWFAGFLAVFAVAALASTPIDPIASAQEFVFLVQAILVMWAGSNLLQDRRVARWVLGAFVVACVVRAALPLAGVGRTGDVVWTGGERLTAFGQNANSSAKILGTGVLFALAGPFLTEGRARRWRWLVWPMLALLVIAIMDTGSRGGLLTLSVGLLTMAAVHGRTLGARVRTLLGTAAALGVLAFAATHTEVMENRLQDAAQTGKMAGREQLFPALWQMFLERPILGWGPVNNHYEVALRARDMIKVSRDAHNLELELLSAEGVVGTIPYVVGLALCVAAAWRARRGPDGGLPIALMFAWLAANQTGNHISAKPFWFVLAYVVAAGAAAAPLRGGGRDAAADRRLAAAGRDVAA